MTGKRGRPKKPQQAEDKYKLSARQIKAESECFGKLYNKTNLLCSQQCPDQSSCRIAYFNNHTTDLDDFADDEFAKEVVGEPVIEHVEMLGEESPEDYQTDVMEEIRLKLYEGRTSYSSLVKRITAKYPLLNAKMLTDKVMTHERNSGADITIDESTKTIKVERKD